MMCSVVFKLPLGSSFLEINRLFRNKLKHVREQSIGGISEVATNNISNNNLFDPKTLWKKIVTMMKSFNQMHLGKN